MPRRTLTPFEKAHLRALSLCDPRTIEKWWGGGVVRESARARLERAAARLGLLGEPPAEPTLDEDIIEIGADGTETLRMCLLRSEYRMLCDLAELRGVTPAVLIHDMLRYWNGRIRGTRGKTRKAVIDEFKSFAPPESTEAAAARGEPLVELTIEYAPAPRPRRKDRKAVKDRAEAPSRRVHVM